MMAKTRVLTSLKCLDFYMSIQSDTLCLVTNISDFLLDMIESSIMFY